MHIHIYTLCLHTYERLKFYTDGIEKAKGKFIHE